MRSRSGVAVVAAMLLVGIMAACSPPAPGGASRDAVVGGGSRPSATITVAPTVRPVSRFPQYRLNLVLEPEGRRLVGTQQVTIPNHTGVDLEELVFRLYPNLPQYQGRMSVGDVWVEGQRTSPVLRADDTSLAIPLERPLAPETELAVELTFEIAIPEPQTGYVLFGLSQGIWSVPDGYALLAVHDGKTWHEDIAPSHGDAVFAEAALYDATLTLPGSMTLVATGSVVSETVRADGQQTIRIVGGPLREFAWLGSADYLMTETSAYGTRLRSYFLAGDDAAGQASLDMAAAALRSYQDAFGPYPFEEMIVAEAPLLHFGMEYPGLNLIGLDLYRDQRAQLEDRVVHEVAHQWWYAQVGNDQVNTPWLDEGLAEYSMAIYYGQVYGQARVNTLINQRWLVPYQVAVENEYDAVVNQPSSAFSWEYQVIVYGKAALFFNALHQELGDETFERVLREYVDRYRWRIATPDSFLSVAESVSGQDLDGLYNEWILGKK
jgi:hypothetical protein